MIINSTASVKAFKNDHVVYLQICEYEYRICDNGVLLGSYINEKYSIKLNNSRFDTYRYDNTYDDKYHNRYSIN